MSVHSTKFGHLPSAHYLGIFFAQRFRMSRKPLVRSSIHPYHVLARVNNRECFALPINQVWVLFINQLEETQKKFGIKIHAFVLMSNHFHLVLTVPKSDLGYVMQHFMQSITISINRVAARSGRVFGARYHKSVIENDHYIDQVIKYVYRNPVKAAMVEKVEDYLYSSIHHALDRGLLPFQMHPPVEGADLIPQNDEISFLTWLNQPFQNEIDDLIAKSLKKMTFEPHFGQYRPSGKQAEFTAAAIQTMSKQVAENAHSTTVSDAAN